MADRGSSPTHTLAAFGEQPLYAARFRTTLTILLLSVLFLVSGFAALIYQIVWQRALFTAFGVNIESITIVVAVFMFGLGVGSLVGGWLSQRWPDRLPLLFFLCEIAIGLFGLVSLPLIKAVSAVTLHGSLFVTAITIYGLLCIPTIFMGATLPILSAYLHRTNRNVGKAVSTLYLCNTAGSAIACFVTADMLFGALGQQATLFVAAACNFLVGLCVYGLVGVDEADAETADEDNRDEAPPSSRDRRRLTLVLLLAGAVGYVALSQEILWFRAISYVTTDRPTDFAHVLGCVLFGIALGAGCARWLCRRNPDGILTYVGVLLVLSALLYGVSLPMFAEVLIKVRPEDPSHEGASTAVVLGFLLVATTAALLGAVFPLLCHYAVRGGGVGRSISWIYFANIVGSTAGPLLTGFILLDAYTLEQNMLILTLVTAVLGALVMFGATCSEAVRGAVLAVLVVGMAFFVAKHSDLYEHILEKLHYKYAYNPKEPYKYVLQNRNGIIAIQADPHWGDVIYGGTAYDGRFNIDPVKDGNGITRAFQIVTMHPKVEDVIIIGLSGGSWLKALTMHTGLKKIIVVEINPGYLEIVKHYPEIEEGLKDPRVTVYVDDGRRWLNRHPDEKFDVMVMNSIYHWRGQATNLLSEDFLRICKSRLKDGGYVYYNSTGSEDVFYTAAEVFKHVGACGNPRNIVLGADKVHDLTKEERRQNLLGFMQNGKPLFTASSELEAVMQKLIDFEPGAAGSDPYGAYYRKRTDLWLITDNNMATEFRKRRPPDPVLAAMEKANRALDKINNRMHAIEQQLNRLEAIENRLERLEERHKGSKKSSAP